MSIISDIFLKKKIFQLATYYEVYEVYTVESQ
jgi:hypothetical protein